jgi:hypothetical protein
MQALLSAGLIGLVVYTASWVVAWIMFVRCLKHRESLPPLHRILLIQCGAILTFFTVRSIPETTTASFSVDLLVMVPVMMYLEILDRQLRSSPGTLMERTNGGLGDRQPQRAAAAHFKQLQERFKVET